MNIEESIEVLKNMILMPDGWIIGKNYKGNLEFIGCLEGQEAIEILLTAYNDIKTEHKIMKRLIVENGLWERLLNDDEFIKHLEEE